MPLFFKGSTIKQGSFLAEMSMHLKKKTRILKRIRPNT